MTQFLAPVAAQAGAALPLLLNQVLPDWELLGLGSWGSSKTDQRTASDLPSTGLLIQICSAQNKQGGSWGVKTCTRGKTNHKM